MWRVKWRPVETDNNYIYRYIHIHNYDNIKNYDFPHIKL